MGNLIIILWIILLLNWLLQSIRRIYLHYDFIQKNRLPNERINNADFMIFTNFAFLQYPSLFIPYVRKNQIKNEEQQTLYKLLLKRIKIEWISFVAIIVYWLFLVFII